MAEKRMISKKITDTDAFLDMPLSTQALYFHFIQSADDDGFVGSPNTISRKIGANKNDLDVLILKNFIIPFETGVIVIKHWKIHNYIQNDRYHKTTYVEEYGRLSLKENKSYTLEKTPCIQNVSKMEAEIRLDKISIDKNSINNIVHNEFDFHSSFKTFWEIYLKKSAKEKSYQAFKKFCKDEKTFNEIIKNLKKQIIVKGWDKDSTYMPHASTWLNGKRWLDELPTIKSNVIEIPAYESPTSSLEEQHELEEWLNQRGAKRE